MFHKNRVWSLPRREAESAEWLAGKLVNHTWTTCSTFRIGSYLFLNDSTSEDGAQEYAIVKQDGERFVQIESITFGWCDEAKALKYVRQIIAGEFDDSGCFGEVFPRLETADDHGRCGACA